MADSILTAHREKLLSALTNNLETVSEKCLSNVLVKEEDTIFSEVRRPSRSREDLSIELLSSITESVATDNSRFEIVLNILKSVLPCENEGFEWIKEMEERYSDMKLTLPPKLKRLRTGESPPPMCDIPESVSGSESPEVMRTFWAELVIAVSSCVVCVSGQCYSTGLISNETYSKVLACSCRDEKTRILLTSVRRTIDLNRSCFEIFLNILKEALPLGDQDELMLKMGREYAKLKQSLGSDEGSASANIKSDGLLTGSPQVKTLQKFHAELVTAISECVLMLNGLCFSRGLINGSEQMLILESKEGSEDKARNLLVCVTRKIEADKREALFNVFLSVLKEALPQGTREPLLTNIKDAHGEFKGYSSSSALNAEDTHHQVQSSDIADVVKSLKYSIETITRSEDEKYRLEIELRLKKEENEQLKAKLTAMESERRGNEKADEEIMELKLQIENRDSEIVKLQEKIKEQEEIIDRHQMKVRREEAVAEEESKVVTNTLREAENVQQKMKEKIQSLENEKSQLKAHFEARIEGLSDELRKAERDKRIFSRRLNNNGLRTSITHDDIVYNVVGLDGPIFGKTCRTQ